MTARNRPGSPRSLLGHLDQHIVALLILAESAGKDSEPVKRKRAAILQRIRRIVRTEKQR
jgi:hypothetical protein